MRALRPILSVTIVALLAASGAVGQTSASLADSASLASITTKAGSVEPPTGLDAARQGTDVALTATAPDFGIVPQAYEVHRRIGAGPWSAEPVAVVTSPSWVDTSAPSCTALTYRMRSTHANLRSAWSGITATATDAAPTLSASVVIATSGSSPVAGFLRPTGQFFAYASANDDCDAPSAITAAFDLSALGVAGGPQTALPGSFTPISGGPTYQHRVGPVTASGALTHGSSTPWTVRLVDSRSNSATEAASAPVADAVAPTHLRLPEVVSAATNYFSSTLGRGEIRSAGAGSPHQFYVYADVVDALSGVAGDGVTSNTTSISAVPESAALPLAGGTFGTDNAVAWTFRSAGTAAKTSGLANGSLQTFTVTAVDRVGNAATTAVQQVEIDDTALTATACTSANGGTSGWLDAGDATTFTFGDVVDPGTLSDQWTGAAALTGSATVRNGAAADLLTFELAAITRGSTSSADALGLAATNWLSSGTSAFASSTFSRLDDTRLRVEYAGGPAVRRRATSGTIHWSNTLRDAAGNQIAADTATACGTAF